MSGLEKFQANDAWKALCKKLLLTERQITPLPKEPSKQTQRYSYDISEDLFVILEEKKIPKSKSSSCNTETKKHLEGNLVEDENKIMSDLEDKENVSLNATQNRHTFPTKLNDNDNISTTTRRYSAVSYCNDTLLEEHELPQWQRTSDESFEAIEKMCDKTASDPNSTLFKYLHSDNKENIVKAAKIRSGIEIKEPVERGYDAEASALKRLLDELRYEEEQMQLEKEKSADVTQLEDIEAPSRLWENTITGENIIQTSPVKMVGLLRPSTIIEDPEDSNSDLSSQMSFQSISTKATSEVSSAYYETAYDTTTTSCATNADAVPQFDELGNDFCPLLNSNDLNPLPEVQNSAVAEETINLIDLEETILFDEEKNRSADKTCTSKVGKESSDSEDSVIEILSDDENEEISVLPTPAPIKYEDVSISTQSTSSKSSRSIQSKYTNDVDEKKLAVDDSDDDKSLHFNDTMEEVEYMMNKGIQLLAAVKPPELERLKTPVPAKSSPLKIKQNTFLISPKADDRYRSPSPMLHKQIPFSTSSIGKAKNGNTTPKSAEKQIAKPKAFNPFTKEIKPFPKLDIFKKPTTSAMPTNANMRHKDLTVKQFAHIVSPIRTYIKNSTNTPLMSTINDINRNPNSLTSMHALEIEGRLYKPNFEGGYGCTGVATTSLKSASPRSLPKKAYISSELKHIIDERTPVTIPGGKQYQKHIETAMLPAVLKHEGKLKLPEVVGNQSEASKKPDSSHSTSNTARRTDRSLADLSVMSGDISMYTIKDAQKL